MKVNIDVPQELSDITLIQYQRFLKLQEESEDEVFLGQKMIEIFCNVSENIVKSLKVNDAYAIVDILTKMLEKKTELRRVIKIKGVKYGFIPNLDEITFGEYVDLDTHLGKWDEMHKAMAVLYRPIENEKNGKYNIKDYDAKFNEDLLYIPMDAVMGSIVFFFHLGKDLSKVMMNYLMEKQENRLVQYINSQLDGDGSPLYMDYLKEILGELKISLN
mgnify:CR=1 FL=1